MNSVILREIGALARTVHAISDQRFKAHRLQKGQSIFLTRICEHPGINLTDLSILLKVDKTTTTKAVQKLMAEGYVQREDDSHDKRKIRLYPTDLAEKIYKDVIAEEDKNIAICFEGFTLEEQAEVCRLVSKMRRNMESNWLELKKYREGYNDTEG